MKNCQKISPLLRPPSRRIRSPWRYPDCPSTRRTFSTSPRWWRRPTSCTWTPGCPWWTWCCPPSKSSSRPGSFPSTSPPSTDWSIRFGVAFFCQFVLIQGGEEQFAFSFTVWVTAQNRAGNGRGKQKWRSGRLGLGRITRSWIGIESSVLRTWESLTLSGIWIWFESNANRVLIGSLEMGLDETRRKKSKPLEKFRCQICPKSLLSASLHDRSKELQVVECDHHRTWVVDSRPESLQLWPCKTQVRFESWFESCPSLVESDLSGSFALSHAHKSFFLRVRSQQMQQSLLVKVGEAQLTVYDDLAEKQKKGAFFGLF